MGQIIKLNGVFGNSDLPVIIDRNITALEAEIKALPGLKAFWDMTDSAVRTMSGDRIVKIQDKSAAGNDLLAEAATAPVLDGSILGGASAYFDGTSEMVSGKNIFSVDSSQFTVVVFAYKTENTTPPNTMLVAGQNNATVGLYTNNVNIVINSNGLRMEAGSVVGKPLSLIASSDFAERRGAIKSPDDSVLGYDLAARTIKDDLLVVSKWPTSGKDGVAQGWKGYIGHIAIFDKFIADNDYICDILFEYSRRKYNI